jgi:peptide/nickel transport system substrate-binding protein
MAQEGLVGQEAHAAFSLFSAARRSPTFQAVICSVSLIGAGIFPALQFRQMAEVMQSMVREAGIDMKIEVRELATAAGMMNRGEFQAFLIGWSGRVDPDGNIFAFNHCRGANNDSKFCDPRVDAALEAARATVNQAERAGHYATAMGIALPARHRIYLVHEGWRFAHAARLSGFQALPDGIMRLEGVKLD